MAKLDDGHLDKYVGPESLTELSLKLICENLDIISTYKRQFGHRILSKGLAFPSEICDKIVEYVLRNDTIEDHDCFFTIFKDVTATKLKTVKIRRSNLTDKSVQILTSHKLVELELTDCLNVTERSIDYINANSKNLRSLVCYGDTMILPNNQTEYWKHGYVFDTPALQRLSLEFVLIPPSDYDILLAGLTNLRHLDLSNSYSIGNFDVYHRVPNLVSLILYNVKLSAEPESFVNNISHLKSLRHLDISHSNPNNGIFTNPNKTLSDIVNGLPELISLDIGGTNLAGRGTADHTFISKINDASKNREILCDVPGLMSRVNRPLEFLGLYGTHDGACRRCHIPAKMIAGDANKDQMLVAARVFMNNKHDLLQKVLNDLYHIFKNTNCPKMNQALHIVLEAMEKHPYQKHIQISGSATLFYIVKMKEKDELEMGMKKRIISTLLNGMSIHKDDQTMIRNGCLALGRFRIPQDVMSNYEELVKVLLHSATHTEPEGFVQRIGIYLLNTLACQVDGREKRLLGRLGCVKTMLKLVKSRVETGTFDDVLEVAWSTMWNMTDETPINCERFLSENGMGLFLICIRQYPFKEDLLRNMMGLVGNVAEVKELRSHLMYPPCVSVFTNLMHSYTDDIEVSYNAAGTLAHMASDGVKAWTVDKPSRDQVLEYMVEAIDRWNISAQRNINYRSFVPLLRLVDVYHTPQCQHWAVWALANLTHVYSSKYCALVVEEGGIEKLQTIISDPRPYKRTKELAQFVIDNCSRYNNNSDNTNAPQPPTDSNSTSTLDG